MLIKMILQSVVMDDCLPRFACYNGSLSELFELLESKDY